MTCNSPLKSLAKIKIQSVYITHEKTLEDRSLDFFCERCNDELSNSSLTGE
jgi:hypothetical protein